MLEFLGYDLHVMPELYEQYKNDLLLRIQEPVPFEEIEKKGAKFMQVSSMSSIKTIPSSGDLFQEAVQ